MEGCRLLDGVLAAVEAGCKADDLTAHWEVFRRRVLDPTLTGAAAPPLPVVCDELGIRDEVKGETTTPRERIASRMIPTVTRRFRAAVKARIQSSMVLDDSNRDQNTGKTVDQAVHQFVVDLMQDLAGSSVDGGDDGPSVPAGGRMD